MDMGRMREIKRVIVIEKEKKGRLEKYMKNEEERNRNKVYVVKKKTASRRKEEGRNERIKE